MECAYLFVFVLEQHVIDPAVAMQQYRIRISDARPNAIIEMLKDIDFQIFGDSDVFSILQNRFGTIVA